MSEIASIVDDFAGADTIPALLSRAVDRFPNEIAVKTNVKGTIVEKTYLQLKKDSNAVSVNLKKMGIKANKVAFIGKICYEWVVTYFGVTGSRNIVVPIDKDLSMPEVEKLLCLADVSVLFFDDSNMDVAQYIRHHCKNVKLIVCFQPTESFPSLFDFNGEQGNTLPDDINVQADQTAMIVFTSGTTGESKGVMLSHQNICHNIICSIYLIGKDTFIHGECTVPILPPHHMLEITTGILAPMLFYGITICIGGGLKDVSKNLKQFRPVLLIMVPMVVEGIYKRIWSEAQKRRKGGRLKFAIKLSNLLLKLRIDIRRVLFRGVMDSLGGELRIIVCGGAHMDSDLVEKFRAFGITLLNGYGITECSPVVTCNPTNHIKRNSVGLVAPVPYCQVKIEGDEILIRGSIVMQGYYKEEVKTMEAFDREWFKTGDLGYLDKDNYLFITGRKKNLIILKDGNNISPEELEHSIEQHPLVDSVFVYAMHKNKADILVAAIHPNYKYAMDNGIDDSKATLEKVIVVINQKWPRYKRIQMVEVYEKAFDRTALGKVKRFKYIR